MGKYTRGNVGGLQKHNQRENKNYGNENVDLSKSHLNYDLQNQERIKYLNKIDQIIKENRTSDKAVRKDAIVYVDTIVGSDKEFFRKLSPEDTRRFFEQSYEYLQKKVGEQNIISATVHMDETKGVGGSPHMHFSFVPMNEDGTLSAKKKINRNFLREIQDEFPRYMKEQGFDIERGMENSIKKHLEPLEFKKEQIKNDTKKVQERYNALQNASERLSKHEEHINGVIGKLNNIHAKKGLLGDKLSISQEDYSILIQLAKQGESKLLENLKLKNKVNNLQEKVDKKSLEEQSKDVEFKRLQGIEDKHYNLEREFSDLERKIKKIEKIVNSSPEFRNEFKKQVKIFEQKEHEDMVKHKSRSKSFGMER